MTPYLLPLDATGFSKPVGGQARANERLVDFLVVLTGDFAGGGGSGTGNFAKGAKQPVPEPVPASEVREREGVMPRTARVIAENGIYHVVNRGNGRAVVFRKPADFGSCRFTMSLEHCQRLGVIIQQDKSAADGAAWQRVAAFVFLESPLTTTDQEPGCFL